MNHAERRASSLPSPREMARKVKTPPPPRRAVQAPKQRATLRDDARNKKILYAIGASGFVMLALVVGFFALTGGGDDTESAEGAVATIRAAGWTYQQTTNQGRTHVPELAANFKYNTVPATSGQHSNQTVVYGVYDQPVSEINYVHNLEHGAVGMFYGPDVPEETVAQMQEFYNQDPRGLIMVRRPAGRPDRAHRLDAHREGQDLRRGGLRHVRRGVRLPRPESCKNDIEQGCFRRENLEPGNQ